MPLFKFLDPKNDLAFKRIFGTERNRDILIHFLNDIFARQTNPIESVTFLKTAQNPEVSAQRVSIVDILCKDTEGNRFIVEIQVADEPGFEKRAQYYAAKTYIEQREKNTKYKDLREVTFLAITNFTLFPNKEGYLSHHQVLDTESHERDLKDFSFSFLELPKFTKNKEQLKTMTEKWAWFFKHAPETREEDIGEITGEDHIIKRAYEELNRYSWSPEELRTYDAIDMKKSADKAILEGAFEKGVSQGFEKGISQGIEKASHRIAMNLVKIGLTSEQIAESTGLPVEEVEKLQKQIH